MCLLNNYPQGEVPIGLESWPTLSKKSPNCHKLHLPFRKIAHLKTKLTCSKKNFFSTEKSYFK